MLVTSRSSTGSYTQHTSTLLPNWDSYFHLVDKGGELVVGNFCTSNPTRDYMEFAKWVLLHRSAATLRQLALEAGMPEPAIRVEAEPEGINLFLRVAK